MSLLRQCLISLFAVLCLSVPVAADDAAWDQLKSSGVVLFRHANAPGVGDPAGFVIDDCGTQRNLDDRGREQARAIGKAFRTRGIEVAAVLTSQWCRARETAELAFPGQVKEEPAFNSFFGDRSSEPAQTAEARRILLEWAGPGVLVVVSHQVNISALTGEFTGSGEGIVLRRESGELSIAGRIRTPPGT
jgi:phosphohistidine phosphatase SixA